MGLAKIWGNDQFRNLSAYHVLASKAEDPLGRREVALGQDTALAQG